MIRITPALIWVASCCCVLAACHTAELTRTASSGDPLDRLSAFIFGRTSPASGISRALLYSQDGYTFRDLAQIDDYNVRSADGLVGTAQSFQAHTAPIESRHWWNLLRSKDGADVFLRELEGVLAPELAAPNPPSPPRWHSVLHQALAQRDLFHTYSLIHRASTLATDAENQALAVRLQDLVASLLESTLLTQQEFEVLRQALPAQVPPGFVSEVGPTLSTNYLPQAAFRYDATWTQIIAGGTPSKHARIYRGRSFVKVYVRGPSLTPADILTLWEHLFDWYGADLHTSAVNDPVPQGFETMLIRSFGVFLTDGTYRDSHWPEEIIIRMFKHPTAKPDLQTSDFRGTLFYQYLLSRERLLAQPSTLGLRRVLDDEVQFYGFFGDVPDPRNAYSNVLTTMRANCITCHSELFYGLNTIFSFGRNPRPSESINQVDPSLLKVGSDAQMVLDTEEARSLRDRLAAFNHWSKLDARPDGAER